MNTTDSKQPEPSNEAEREAGFAEAHGSAAKRAREVLLYCKLWTEGDMELPHLRPERKCLEHRIGVIADAIKQLDALPPNAKLCGLRGDEKGTE